MLRALCWTSPRSRLQSALATSSPSSSSARLVSHRIPIVWLIPSLVPTRRRNFALENYRNSYTLMQELRQRIPNVNIGFYVSAKVIEGVHRALDIPLARGGAQQGRQEDEIADESM